MINKQGLITTILSFVDVTLTTIIIIIRKERLNHFYFLYYKINGFFCIFVIKHNIPFEKLLLMVLK